MGLDIYVGTFTRYYSKNWKTVVQQWAEENDHEYNVISPETPSDELTDPADIQMLSEAWRDNLAEALKKHTSTPIFWKEDNETPYSTDKPDWDGYGAVIMWALYLEQNIKPSIKFDSNWTDSKVFTNSNAEDYKTRFASLTQDCEIWLPIDIDFTFKYPDPTEKEVGIGSSIMLLQDLTNLNKETWNASVEEIESWCREIEPNTDLLEEKAKFGFSKLYALAKFSVDNKLPIKLDY